MPLERAGTRGTPGTLRLYVPEKEIEDGSSKQKSVNTIEHPAVAGDERAAVFHVGGALQHRLEQVADDAGDDDAEAEAGVPVPGKSGSQ